MASGAAAAPASCSKVANPAWYKIKTTRKNATKAQRRALRELFPRYAFSFGYDDRVVDEAWVQRTYGRGGGFVLDIGFGLGDALVEMARAAPEKNFLGVDWHTPGVGRCLMLLEKAGLTNVRLVASDAVTFLRRNVVAEAKVLRGVNVFFPDPWSKDRRVGALRIVRPEVAYLVATHALPGAPLHLATDVPGYPAHAAGVMADAGYTGGVIPRPDWRPVTNYEEKGLAAGRDPVDAIYYPPAVPVPCVLPAVAAEACPVETDGGEDSDISSDEGEGCHATPLFD